MDRSRVRRACAVVVAGLLIAACAGGEDEAEGASSGASDPTPTTTGEPPSADTDTTKGDGLFMPDVLGQTEGEAREVLGELGLDDDALQVVERESLEEPGTIVDQVPSSGQRISGSVNLVVAKPIGPVPDFVGQQLSDVEDWAGEREIEVRIEEVLDDTLGEGEVVGTTPASDEEATSEILVRVGRQPIVEGLSGLEPADRDQCYALDGGEASINGESYGNTVTVGVNGGVGSSCSFEYDFGRDWVRMKATLGVTDDSSSDLRYRFSVFADDAEIYSQEVGFGETAELDEDVTGILRVRLQIDLLSGDAGKSAWGDLRRIGSPQDAADDEGEGGTTTTTEP